MKEIQINAQEGMRAMACVRMIDGISPIEGADAIECAVVGGWKVVVKKGEFNVGELAVYCEIDSWIPTELAPFLSRGKEPREYNGVKGERLRTVRLRGQISQGLLLKAEEACINIECELFDGLNVSFPLNVQKWEPVIPAQLAGQVKGTFPTLIPKTDQERVQNMAKEIKAIAGRDFEVTEKLEGSSMTCYLIDGEFGVCSRNMDLKRDENNTFWRVAIEQDIEAKMRQLDEHWNFAIQGELIGPGIQGNIYKLTAPDFYVFDVYNIQTGKYFSPSSRRALVENMGLKHAPVVGYDVTFGTEVEEFLSAAEDKSLLNPEQEREGIVLKENGGDMTFKAISNKYLLEQK